MFTNGFDTLGRRALPRFCGQELRHSGPGFRREFLLHQHWGRGKDHQRQDAVWDRAVHGGAGPNHQTAILPAPGVPQIKSVTSY